jgi:hypothetical protein
MRYSAFVVLALVGSTSAFVPTQQSCFRTQSGTANSLVQVAAQPRDDDISQNDMSQKVTSTLAASVLALLLATTLTSPVNAATTTTTAPSGPVPAEKKALDTAKQSVTTQNQRLVDLKKAIKDEKLADTKAAAAEKKAEATLSKAKIDFDRENTYLLNMPPKTPSMSLQAQKSKVGT